MIEPSAPTATSTGFVGWYRVGRTPWTPGVTGATRAETAERLHEFLRVAGHRHRDTMVLPVGQGPDGKPS